MSTNQDNPTVLPSGKYAVDEVERGIVRVLQLIEGPRVATEFADYDGRWFATPGRWYARTLLADRPFELALDFGQGWRLDAADTTAVLEFASDVEVDLP